ncbi:MAG: efflux RND transporter periplasmic adaptor subunit [Phycisphaerales bacterium]
MRTGVAVVALLLGVGFFAALVATRPEAPRKPRTETAIPVEVVTAREVAVSRPWEGLGTARSMRVADIRAEVAGVIVRRPAAIEPGVTVREGETILQIDPTDYESAVSRSEAMLASLEAQMAALAVEEDSLREQVALASQASELAERDVQRAREAARGGAAIEREIDTLLSTLTRTKREESQLKRSLAEVPARRDSLEAQLEAERANLRLARENLERTTITAPFDGTLQSVSFREGERAAAGDQAARLVSLARIETPLRVPVSAAGELRVGAPATIVSEGQIRRTWDATIERISPEADPQSRTVTVFAVVEQDPGGDQANLLLPGRFVRGRFGDLRPAQRVLAPRIAVQGESVMVVDEGGVVRRRPVVVAFYLEGLHPEIDPEEREWAAIERGLEPGDRVVVSNLDDLAPGTSVRAMGAAEVREGLATGNGRGAEGSK